MKAAYILLLTMVAAATSAEEPQVDTAEVLRRGDMVVVAGEGPRSVETEAFITAMAPPPDDSHKWFVTLFTQPNCPPCAALKRDFSGAPELAAFVTADDDVRAWAHFNVYDRADGAQAFRLKQYKIAGYPTLVIQPPRNGMWGDPGIVVYQTTGYDGKPANLAKAMRDAVRAFCEAQAKRGYPRAHVEAKPHANPGFSQDVGQGGNVGIPFTPAPKVDPQPYPYQPYMPQPQPFDQWPPAPPEQSPVQIPQIPGTGMWGLLLTMFANLGLNLFFLYREFRQKNNQPVIVPESIVNPIVNVLKDIFGPRDARPSDPTK